MSSTSSYGRYPYDIATARSRSSGTTPQSVVRGFAGPRRLGHRGVGQITPRPLPHENRESRATPSEGRVEAPDRHSAAGSTREEPVPGVGMALSCGLGRQHVRTETLFGD